MFTGCGKTWLAEHQEQYGYTMLDIDSSTYEKSPGWEEEYVQNVINQAESGKYDFVFICQTESVLDEMDRRCIAYVIVEPDNIVWNEPEPEERKKKRKIIKQQWFGRLILRDNSHIADFDSWLKHIKEIYDVRTSLGFLNRHTQLFFIPLSQDEYLSDVIDELYWKKEHFIHITTYEAE